MPRLSPGKFPSFAPVSTRIPPFLATAITLGVGLFLLQGCSVYYNTYFNAEKAQGQALRLRERRLELNPEDTVKVSAEEKAKLQRAIVKSSKVLELWPSNRTYAPKAVYLIAESYLLMEDYDQAAPKYAEFIRYFPTHEKIPVARAHWAKALYLSGQKLNARDALEALIATNPEGEAKREALLLSARMQVDDSSGLEGLAVYDKLLAEGAFATPEARAEAHWQAGRLAYTLQQWERARQHLLASDIQTLAPRLQYRNRKLAVLCLYALGRYAEGVSEIESLEREKEFRMARADLLVLKARGLEGRRDWAGAETLYRQAVRDSKRSATGAEAFYRLALHFWDVADREDSARVYFDSASAAGRSFEFGLLGEQKAIALGRIRDLRFRDSTGADSLQGPFRDFTLAEVFLFDLQRPDSARVHWNRLVASPREDSVYSRRAFLALAWLESQPETPGGSRERADSLYQAVLARYPGTEWAKQAEQNLGLPPTVQTNDDKAHLLFLEAERRRFADENVSTRVIPAYREIVKQYPASSEASKSLFIVAYLQEQMAFGPPRSAAASDSAKAVYEEVSRGYPGTVFAELAAAKILSPSDEPGTRLEGPPEEGGDDEDTERKPVVETVDPRGEEDLY
jgi:TolA-binding protein